MKSQSLLTGVALTPWTEICSCTSTDLVPLVCSGKYGKLNGKEVRGEGIRPIGEMFLQLSIL